MKLPYAGLAEGEYVFEFKPFTHWHEVTRECFSILEIAGFRQTCTDHPDGLLRVREGTPHLPT
jgi:hypothetical protein